MQLHSNNTIRLCPSIILTEYHLSPALSSFLHCFSSFHIWKQCVRMQTWCVNPPVVLSVEISRREVVKYNRHNSSDQEESCQTVWDVCENVHAHNAYQPTLNCSIFMKKMSPASLSLNSILCPSLPLSAWPYRRSRRPATPSSVLGVVM